MRALVCRDYGPVDNLVIEDWDDPVPGDGQVAFDVKAAGLNFPDLLMIAGKYQMKPDFPFIPGTECAGVVTQVWVTNNQEVEEGQPLFQIDADPLAEGKAYPVDRFVCGDSAVALGLLAKYSCYIPK